MSFTLKKQKQAVKIFAIASGVTLACFGLGKLFNSVSFESNSKPAPTPTETTVTVFPKHPPAAPAVKTQASPEKKKDNADEKAKKLSALETSDLTLLGNQGYKVEKRLMPFGRDCDCCNGGTDASGYHGTSTSISYQVTAPNGDHGKICVAHSGKQGSKVKVGSFKKD